MHIFFEISRKFFNNSIRGNIRCGSSESSETLNGGQFTFLTQLVKPNYLLIMKSQFSKKGYFVLLKFWFFFTIHQVVNFMSTDTDRVVNFAPSFHQFWSLPFQIGVSLYLLHQQVKCILIFIWEWSLQINLYHSVTLYLRLVFLSWLAWALLFFWYPSTDGWQRRFRN